jgi:hypothetical protein
MRDVSDKMLEKIKTHVLCRNMFLEIEPCMRHRGKIKYSRTGHQQHYSANCLLWQQWLHECDPVLRFKFNCLSCIKRPYRHCCLAGGGGGGVKRMVSEPDHWAPSSAEIKYEWIYTSTRPNRPHCVGRENGTMIGLSPPIRFSPSVSLHQCFMLVFISCIADAVKPYRLTAQLHWK